MSRLLQIPWSGFGKVTNLINFFRLGLGSIPTHWNSVRFIENKRETVVGFAVFRTIANWILMGQKVRFPSPAPLLHPSVRTVYNFDRAVGTLILTTNSMSFIWDLTASNP
jgi:hypothetical protein